MLTRRFLRSLSASASENLRGHLMGTEVLPWLRVLPFRELGAGPYRDGTVGFSALNRSQRKTVLYPECLSNQSSPDSLSFLQTLLQYN